MMGVKLERIYFSWEPGKEPLIKKFLREREGYLKRKKFLEQYGYLWTKEENGDVK